MYRLHMATVNVQRMVDSAPIDWDNRQMLTNIPMGIMRLWGPCVITVVTKCTPKCTSF